MPKLDIVGWRKGLLKISMTKVLREHLSLGLKDAKTCVDDVIQGKVVSLDLASEADIEALARALDEVGAIVKIKTKGEL